MNSITRNSNNGDYYTIPVARSYNNRNWERVAGPYAQSLSISNCCKLVIPNLSDDDGKFLLMSFTHQINEREQVSRFFQQTTFGPDLDMINSWNYNTNIDQEMGSWVKAQMDETQTPITSHRAFYRERVDYSTIRQNAEKFRRPRHPCAKYARWREYSFGTSDMRSMVEVSRWNNQFLFSVDGVPRTVMNSFQDDVTGENLALGTYMLGECLYLCLYRFSLLQSY